MKKHQNLAIVKRVFLVTISILVISALAQIANSQSDQTAVSEAVSISPDRPSQAELLTLTNRERSKAGLVPLKHDARLDASAQLISDRMKSESYFAHVNPHTGTRNASEIFKYVEQHECAKVGENISLVDSDNFSSDVVIDGWMNSKKHKEAILSAEYDYVGFGISGRYVVQHFCQLY